MIERSEEQMWGIEAGDQVNLQEWERSDREE